MVRVLVVLALVLPLAFAGCVDREAPLAPVAPPENETLPGTPAYEEAVRNGSVAPEWAPGHHWRYQASTGGSFGLVVSHDHGENWYLDTTEPDVAWAHFRRPLSLIGEIRKSDLAGSQGSDRIQFLSFPLEEGKTWTTKWDGVERTVKVAAAGATFVLEAYEGQDLRTRYTYDPAVLFLRELVFFTAEGETGFSLTLSEHTTGWTGEVYRWRGGLLLAHSHMGPLIGSQQSFAMPEDTGELWTNLAWRCGGDVGLLLLSVSPLAPDATEEALGLIAECESQEVLIIEEPTAGDWTYQVLATSGAEDGRLEFQAWARTLETYQAPW